MYAGQTHPVNSDPVPTRVLERGPPRKRDRLADVEAEFAVGVRRDDREMVFADVEQGEVVCHATRRRVEENVAGQVGNEAWQVGIEVWGSNVRCEEMSAVHVIDPQRKLHT